MTKDKNKVNKSSRKLVFEEFNIYSVFFSMIRKNALPEGKIVNFYTNTSSGHDKLIIDIGKNKFIYYKYLRKSDKNPLYTAYRKYIFDLDKVNLDVFFENVITKLSGLLPDRLFIDFIRKIVKNEFLKKRFFELIESSPDLKQILLNRIKNLESLT